MSVFSQRRNGYKAGVVSLLLSAIMATWGVIAPGWLKRENVDGEGIVFSDLWFINCQEDFAQCQTAQFSLNDASVLATLGLTSLGLLLLLCACVVIVRTNFCLSMPTYGRAAEVLALFAGLTLFIGCMTYVGDNADFMADFPAYHYGPSFILTLTSSVLTGLGGLLLSIYNKKPGTSYYSRFRRSIPNASSATMVEATTASISSISAITTTTASLQVQGYYPDEHYHVGYGYHQQVLRPGGAAMNGVYYGNEQKLYSSHQNSPIFR